MASTLEPLEKLGEHVVSLLDHAELDRTLAVDEARRVFLQAEVAPRGRWASLGRTRWIWAISGAIAVAIATLVVLEQRRAPLTFTVDGAPGALNTWLAAPKQRALRIEFSDGTQIRLDADSRARVQDIDSKGGTLGLEAGRLHADVVHTSTSVWNVAAGPFTVSVTGTVFDLNWNPSAQELTVSVARGSVSVGDTSSGVARAVRASETLRATAFERFTLSSGNDLASPSEGSAPRADSAAQQAMVPQATAADGDGTEPVEAASHRRLVSTAEWRVLAKRGALREAFASAQVSGFREAVASASSSELLLLGDGARLSGNVEEATFALLALRNRYPADPRSAVAAFSLGKVAFDQRKSYEQAAQWFAASLREQPAGSLAREASGRLIEALSRAHDFAGARLAARDYLAKFPEGPHADLARSILR